MEARQGWWAEEWVPRRGQAIPCCHPDALISLLAPAGGTCVCRPPVVGRTRQPQPRCCPRCRGAQGTPSPGLGTRPGGAGQGRAVGPLGRGLSPTPGGAALPHRHGVRGGGRRRGSSSAGVAPRGWHRALRHRGSPAGGGRAAGGGAGAKQRSVKSRTSHGEGEGCGRLPPPRRRARGRGAGTRWPGGAGSSPAARAGLRGPLCALCCTPRLCTGFRGLCRLPGRKLLSISHVCTREEKAVFNLQVYFCRQLTAAPGTFPCLELNFARAEF